MEQKIAQLKFVLLPLSPWGHKYPVCLAGISPEAGNSDSPQLRKTSFLKNVHLPLTGSTLTRNIYSPDLAPGLRGYSAFLARILFCELWCEQIF